MTRSAAEKLLLDDLITAGYPPKVGHAFHSHRRWEFDLAYPQQKLAVEVDGRGRHQTCSGYQKDCEKCNAAVELGWQVLRYPTASVKTHKRRALIVEQIGRILCGAECEASAGEVLTN